MAKESAASAAQIMEEEVQVLPKARPGERAREKNKPKTLPPHAVILHNDHINGFDFVVETLTKVFGYSHTKAFWFTLQAHMAGRTMVWSGAKEHAELKSEQIRSCGPDPRAKDRGAAPLRTSVEPLPG
jgi:ATP-dependent Clp protease adaptor protein ClpS